MFPASFTMFPLATTPALHATLLHVDVDVVLGVLIGAIVSLSALLVHGALRTDAARASTHTIVLRRRAL
jgi:hypothetical protein